MNIRELRAQRTKLGADAAAIMDAATAASRSMTGEEENQFDNLLEERDKLDATIERAVRLREEDREEAGRQEPEPGTGDAAAMTALRAYFLGGRASLTPAQARALNAGNDPEGGYLLPPMEWVNELIKKVDDAVPLRGLATIRQLRTAESLGVPTLDTDLTDAEWTTEVGTGSQDDSLRFGRRELDPNPLAKRVKVSRKLMRLTTGKAEDIVRDRMAYKFGVTQEKGYMTGDGNKKPLGLFVASADGISTGRDVNSGLATGFTANGLIEAKYTLKAGYWNAARWLFHRDALKAIRKLKTTTDEQYVWQPGLASDRPDTILDVPYIVSEFVPNTFTDGLYGGMIADFSYYWIAEAMGLEIQRLNELYAETDQIGFIGRQEIDAMPVLEEAFVRIKCAS
ncbi:phage major capsid protein [Streptomyces xanthophaeus]|uniref:phage major capsid protein n=1 Tax=Streptomyces xanthophaeus TaxID=67385 RepID=UPI003866DE0E|nr:phage major capsid protein [Streptomyces xanthophaeus]WST62151.1 phage major capsid protein [Streptomyces xanthophaeus]